MRGLICFIFALGAGIPVSWATSSWRVGFVIIAIAGAILFVWITLFAAINFLFPPKIPWYTVKEEHHIK